MYLGGGMRKLRCLAISIGVGFSLALSVSVAPAFADSPDPTRTPAASGSEYIVGFRDGTDKLSLAMTSPGTLSSGPTRVLGATPVVLSRLTPAEARRLANDPAVAYVEPNTPVTVAATQADAPWGLDRIDQSVLPLDGSYTVRKTGAKVKVYVIDTGISAGTPDLARRVAKGRTWVHDGLGTSDCHGHGTQVADIVGGTRFRVARKVTLVPVRVLDCEGNGTAFTTAQALDWVATQHKAGTPAVANLSLSGDSSRFENAAVKRLVADGVTVVVAAGNNGMDACSYSPASARKALTVAASDETDQRAGYSNHGSCVDLYAPGSQIVSASRTGDGSATASGTSMASPHVAGTAALILSVHRRWSPAKVGAEIMRLSLAGAIKDNPAGTANRLLNIAPQLDAVSPAQGNRAGGATVRITGRGLRSVKQVRFDGVRAKLLKVKSDKLLTVRVPAQHNDRAAVLTATTALSTSNSDLRFYYGPGPSVAMVSPAFGDTGGGTEVAIKGRLLGAATAVYFGDIPAQTFRIDSDSQITATAPAQAAGKVTIRVLTPAGWAPTDAPARFTYSIPSPPPPPQVTALTRPAAA